MSKSPTYTSRIIRESELERLRLQVERLKEQVDAERRRADQHADEIAILRQIEVARARWVNGGGR